MHILLSNIRYTSLEYGVQFPGEFALDTIANLTAVSSLRRTNMAGVVG